MYLFSFENAAVFYGYGFCPQVSNKMITDNGTFKKLSPEWNFLKMLLSCVCQTIGSNPFHANDNSKYSCIKHGKLGYCLKVIIFKLIPCVHVDGENNAFDTNLDLF